MRVRGVTIDVHLDPARLSRRSEGLAALRQRLAALPGVDPARVDVFIVERLNDALDAFGERYVQAMMPVIERIAALRQELTDLYDSVMAGETPAPERIRDLYARLDQELDSLKSPTRYADADGLPLPPPRQPEPPPPPAPRRPDPLRGAAVAEAMAGQFGAFRRLADDVQEAFRRAAELATAGLRRVVTSSEGQLERRIRDLRQLLRDQGVEPAEIDKAVEAARRLNGAFAEDLQRRQQEAERLRVAAEIGSIPEEGLRAEVERSPRLQRHIPGGIPMLRHLWGMFQRYRNERGGELDFEPYAAIIQRFFRGDLGEFEAAFRLGDDFVVLKAPDHRPWMRGTDLVVVCRSTGEVWIIDNKAFESDAALTAVGALTRNLPRNLIDDVHEFQRTIPESERPIDIAAPLQRLQDATAAIVLLGPDPDPVRVAAILEEFDVRRVVSNAVGNVPAISTALAMLGIEFADMNRPRAPDPPPDAPRIVLP